MRPGPSAPSANDTTSWDNLRVVLAVARAGSLRKAAADLGINHATVSRKLAAYELALGAHVFDRIGGKLVLTAAGADAVETAERVETEVLGVERRIAGGDLKLEGEIVIALAPSLLKRFAGHFAAFTRAYPGVELQFVTGLDMVNLSRRDADVAIRVTRQPSADLFGRRLGMMTARAWVAHHVHANLHPAPPAEWPWVGWHPRFGQFPSAKWVADELKARIVARCESGRDIEDAVRGGLGAAFLLGPDPAGLVAVPDAPTFSLPVWLLTHQDLRNVARIRVLMRAIGDGISRELRESGAATVTAETAGCP